MKLIRPVLALAVAAIALVGLPQTSAVAGTYTNSSSGSEYAISATTLKYGNNHSRFNLRVWITQAGLPQIGVSKNYSINMYNQSGQQVWSASNQGDRTYSVGGNVTKIVVTPKTKWATLTTHWQKR